MEMIDRLLGEVNISNHFLIDVIKANLGNKDSRADNLLKHNLQNADSNLTILKTSLDALTDDELQGKGAHYLSLCLRHIKRQDSSDTASLAYSVLKELFKRFRSLPDVEKIIPSQSFTDFFQSLTKTPDSFESLECLEVIISEYPKQCSGQRATIEKYIIRFLDCSDDNLVMGAAKCCHALQQVRPSSEKNANAKSSWKAQNILLCSATLKIMNRLFENSKNIYGGSFESIDVEKVDIPTQIGSVLNRATETKHLIDLIEKNASSITLSPAEQIFLLSQRLVNIQIFLQAMFVDQYPVPKSVKTHFVVDTIVHLLSISSPKNSDGQLNTFALTTQIPKIKMAALRTLEALMHCLNSDLLPYSPLIIRLLAENLSWSKSNPSIAAIELKEKTYEAIIMWFNIIKCEKLNTEDNSREKHIFEVIFEDITPHQNVVHLKLGNHSSKNLSKKARKKLAKTSLQESSMATYTPGHKDKTEQGFLDLKLAVAALNCLETILLVSGRFLKPSFHKKIQNQLIKQCYEQQKCKIDSRYSSKHLLALFRALEACRVSVPSSLAGPDQYCLYFYSTLNTCNEELTRFCSSALQAIRLSLHGVPATLNYAPDFSEIEEDSDETKKVLSAKNRDALEKYLGKERFEEIDLTDESLRQNDSVVIDSNPSKEEKQPVVKTAFSSNNIDQTDSREINIVDLSDDDIEIVEPESKKQKIHEPSKETNKRDMKIHEVQTQLPLNESKSSNSSLDATQDVIMYDDNHVSEVIHENPIPTQIESSPLTNETDDSDLPCAQINRKNLEIGSSLEVKISGSHLTDNLAACDKIAPRVNGDVMPEINGCKEKDESELTVDEMMADFVCET